jgi:hypothetical protein
MEDGNSFLLKAIETAKVIAQYVLALKTLCEKYAIFSQSRERVFDTTVHSQVCL